MTPVTTSPRADGEFADALVYYDARGRGRAFLAAFDAAVARIAADPTSLPLQPGHGTLRRSRVGGFPYDLLFRVRPGGAQVLSVWHHHRDPADRPG